MDSATTPGAGRGRMRVPDKPTDAEKQQAREVSLRRIAGLFAPYRWPVLGVVAIIVASSVVGLASPFLLRGVIDVALPIGSTGTIVAPVSDGSVVTIDGVTKEPTATVGPGNHSVRVTAPLISRGQA